MISRVLGNIARVGVGDVVVVHGGIGFQVFVTPPFASELHKGDDVELYTHPVSYTHLTLPTNREV